MFLNVLDQDEKMKFMELVYKVANCDGEYAEEEAEIIKNYQLELGINEIPNTASEQELIEYFATKSETIQKIVYFELYGLISADNNISDDEVLMMEKFVSKFSLTTQQLNSIKLMVEKLQKVYDEIYDVIF